jgi:hypothetical protein
MRYLRSYNENNSDINSICSRYGIKYYTINSDGSIDVDGNVDLRGEGFWDFFGSHINYGERHNWTLDEFPLKFGIVSGDFDCRYNRLKSLFGCPVEVGGNFYISDNKLESLEGCPEEVDRFLAGGNFFKNLVGGPRIVRGDFNVGNNNNLVSLSGGPIKVGGYYGFDKSGLLDPAGICETKNILDSYQTIYCNNTPFFNVLRLFLSNGFGYNCGCVDLNRCNHPKDNEYIYYMISIIIDRGIINGNELNVDNFYSLYYDLLDSGVVDQLDGDLSDLELPGYTLVHF